MIVKKFFILFVILFVAFCALENFNAQTQLRVPWPTLMNSPWPMSKHDPQATGRSSYVCAKTPNVIWTKDYQFGILSGPIIDSVGNLYFGTNSWLPFDSTNYFYSLYPDGNNRWTFYTGETYSTDSGFLIGSDNTVYFASQGGHVYSVDAEGNLMWSRDYGLSLFSHMMNIDLDSAIYISSADGQLYSIYKHNGDTRWKVTFDNGFAASSPTFSPDGQTIYIAGHDNFLYALNLDGSLKWRFNYGPVSVIPLVDNEGHIYVVSKVDSVGLHSINSDGSIRWSFNFADWDANRSLLYCATIDRNGNLYFPSYKQQTKIISVDYEGNFRWEYIFDLEDEEIFVPLICDADGTIYCGSTWGFYYYAISSEGNLIWKLPLNGYEVDNSGAIGSDGTLYIGTHLGSLASGQKKTLIAIRDTVTSVEFDVNDLMSYKLEQNYPNPFNSTTRIRYTVPESGNIVFKVFDILGNEVATILDGYQEVGSYEVIFQADDFVSGMYLYQLRSGDFVSIRKMILLK